MKMAAVSANLISFNVRRTPLVAYKTDGRERAGRVLFKMGLLPGKIPQGTPDPFIWRPIPSGTIAFNNDSSNASSFSPHTEERLSDVLTEFVAAPAAAKNWLVIDDGYLHGLGQMNGQARYLQQEALHVKFPLLGVIPGGMIDADLIRRPEDFAHLRDIASFHSHLIIHGERGFGSELGFLANMLDVLASSMPVVSVIVNGGALTGYQIMATIERGRHMVVLKGTGGYADMLAASGGENLSNHQRSVLELAAANKDLFHFVDLDAGSRNLEELLLKLLEKKKGQEK